MTESITFSRPAALTARPAVFTAPSAAMSQYRKAFSVSLYHPNSFEIIIRINAATANAARNAIAFITGIGILLNA